MSDPFARGLTFRESLLLLLLFVAAAFALEAADALLGAESGTAMKLGFAAALAFALGRLWPRPTESRPDSRAP